MGLSKKTLLYSIILSVIIVSCMVGYFIWMLPSLYIDYRQEHNYELAVQAQKAYMKSRSYQNLESANPMSTISVEIPLQGNSITISNQFFKAVMKVEDQELCDFLDQIRSAVENWEAGDWEAAGNWEAAEQEEAEETDFSAFEDIFADINISNGSTITLDSNYQFRQDMFQVVDSQFHLISEDLFASEVSVTDGVNFYTTYMLMGKDRNDIIITFVFLMTPQMEEIRPVVVKSLPMIIAVSFLVVLISSQIFSRFMIQPIIRLAHHARSMKEAQITDFQPTVVKGKDEISDLGRAWNELHQKLAENYRLLEEENKHQEVFLRASSHQLKTPVAAALLLTDGMIQEVGKYRDTKTYLPQLKEQLQLIQKTIDDILSLNQHSSNMQWERVILSELIQEWIKQNHVLLEEKKLTVSSEGEMPPVKTDIASMQKLIGNLLSNAVSYTPSGEQIKIIFAEHSLSVINYGGKIEEELLPHIFEPFVTSNCNKKGRGLGLYIVSYYSRFLECKVTVQNISNGVEAKLTINSGLEN